MFMQDSCSASQEKPRNQKEFFGIVEELYLQGSDGQSLSGSTCVVKDIFDIKGHITGAGNPDWKRTHAVASANAPVVNTLLANGATILGKSLTDELAFSLDGINVHYGTPLNSLYRERIPGGSSSGSVSAVAGGIVDFGIGSDTAGSIRVPSAYCGLYGIRPTHGAIDINGVVPLGPSFDTVSWCARTPDVLEAVGKVLLGAARQAPASLHEVEKIILLENCFSLVTDANTQTALYDHATRLAGALQRPCESITLPSTYLDECMDSFNTIRSREVWDIHGAWITETKPTFGAGIKERFYNSAGVSNEELAQALSHKELLWNQLISVLEGSLLLFPTTAALPPLLTASGDELLTNRRTNVKLCVLGSLFGLPQVTCPVELHADTKFAISAVARQGLDGLLLAIANLADRCFSNTEC